MKNVISLLINCASVMSRQNTKITKLFLDNFPNATVSTTD